MKESQNLVSVIVPIYKVEQYLDDCVNSIVNQTYCNLEIILVDDGSPDNCGKICDQWAKQDNRIKVIHKENGGLSDARNAGLDIATGDFIAFVDSDDWIELDMYEVMLEAILDTNATMCACGIYDSYEDRTVEHKCIPCEGTANEILPLIYQDTIFPVAAWNKLYRRILWSDFRYPVGKICEDAFTTYLLVDRSEKIVQISKPLYHYRIRANSIMTSKFRPARMDEEEAWRCNYQYLELHYPQVRKAAYDFYLLKVLVLIQTIDSKEIEIYSNEYATLYSILKKNIVYVLFNSSLGLKQRVYFWLIYRRLPH